MSKPNDAKRLHDTAADILKSNNGNIAAAAPKLADTLISDRALALAIADAIAHDRAFATFVAATYLSRLASDAGSKSVPAPAAPEAIEIKASRHAPVAARSRRRQGAHKRARKPGMPTPAQQAGAMRAEKQFIDKVFERRRRGGTWATLRTHELRAVAQADVHQGVSFLQRGFEDIRDGFLCMKIAKHCVAADPYDVVPQALKPALFEKFYKACEIEATQALIESGTRAERELIARAERDMKTIEARVQ